MLRAVPLRVAAIDFLNPAPLMWDFQHEPGRSLLASRYDVRLMQPAECARRLLAGEADLGLIPIAALTSELAVVPGCAIASLHQVRSIQLIVKGKLPLGQVRTVAADTASRSSVAYAELLLQNFYAGQPRFVPSPADVPRMLALADAALVIGDPALLALEQRRKIENDAGPCQWFDIATLWQQHTHLPWVAAVWAVRPAALTSLGYERQLVDDLNTSRLHGLGSIDALVEEWIPRIALPAETIRTYLTSNIYYELDPPVLAAIAHFRQLAARRSILPPLGPLRLL